MLYASQYLKLTFLLENRTQSVSNIKSSYHKSAALVYSEKIDFPRPLYNSSSMLDIIETILLDNAPPKFLVVPL